MTKKAIRHSRTRDGLRNHSSVCIVTPDIKLYYEMDEENKISLKDIPSYHSPTKEEGKEQYAKFSKDFSGKLKNLRFLLEPGGIERFLGREPGRRPAAAGPDRQEWLTRSMAYETKQDKLEMHAATALGALERSFPYGTTPRNISDKAAQAPDDVPPAEWTYQLVSSHAGKPYESNINHLLLSI